MLSSEDEAGARASEVPADGGGGIGIGNDDDDDDEDDGDDGGHGTIIDELDVDAGVVGAPTSSASQQAVRRASPGETARPRGLSEPSSAGGVKFAPNDSRDPTAGDKARADAGARCSAGDAVLGVRYRETPWMGVQCTFL